MKKSTRTLTTIFMLFGMTFFSQALVSCGGALDNDRLTDDVSNEAPDEAPDEVEIDGKGEVRLEGATSALTIPAGSLAEGVTVMLDEEEEAIGLPDRLMPLSSVVHLSFSRSEIASTSMELQIEVDSEFAEQATSEGKGIYAKILIEGDSPLPHEPREEPEWTTTIGRYDSDTSIYSIPLMATAEAIRIVVVSGTALTVVTTGASEEENADADGSRARKDNGQTRDVIAGFGTRPWAIICELDEFPADQGHLCNRESDGYELTALLTRLTEVGKRYQEAGWTRALLKTGREGDLVILANPRDGVLDQTGGLPDDETTLYNVVFFTAKGQTNCAAAGAACYNPVSGLLEFTPGAISGEHTIAAGDAIAHEMFHAIQAAEILNVFNQKWLIEGTASAMGFWYAVNGSPVALMTKKMFGAWRDWKFGLSADIDLLLPYQTLEFFTHIDDGNMGYLHPLFDILHGSGAGLGYNVMSNALQAALGSPLEELYTGKVIGRRTRSNGYPHCSEVPYKKEDKRGGVTSDLEPFSAKCLYLDTEIGEDSCLVISLPSGKDKIYQRLMVNGRIIPDLSLTTHSSSVDINVIDIDSDRGDAIQEEYTLTIVEDPECGDEGEEEDEQEDNEDLPPAPRPRPGNQENGGDRFNYADVDPEVTIDYAHDVASDPKRLCQIPGIEDFEIDILTPRGLRNENAVEVKIEYPYAGTTHAIHHFDADEAGCEAGALGCDPDFFVELIPDNHPYGLSYEVRVTVTAYDQTDTAASARKFALLFNPQVGKPPRQICFFGKCWWDVPDICSEGPVNVEIVDFGDEFEGVLYMSLD